MEVMLLFFENFNLTKKNLELFAIFFAKLLTSARSSFTQKNFFTTQIQFPSFLEFVVYFVKNCCFLYVVQILGLSVMSRWFMTSRVEMNSKDYVLILEAAVLAIFFVKYSTTFLANLSVSSKVYWYVALWLVERSEECQNVHQIGKQEET